MSWVGADAVRRFMPMYPLTPTTISPASSITGFQRMRLVGLSPPAAVQPAVDCPGLAEDGEEGANASG
ncbi:MAG: hypothetical protein AMXMBFR13_44620 [Phycisphaerae bacterium]